jgi:hypothetical protein
MIISQSVHTDETYFCWQEGTKKKAKEVSEEKPLYKGEPEPPPVWVLLNNHFIL